MLRNLVTAIAGLCLFTACNHPQKQADKRDGHGAHGQDRHVSALTDAPPEAHAHGGTYSYNPVKKEYDYTPNEDDIIAGHTFVMLGADQTVGHHVAFFESRHQHQVIIKMKLTDTKSGKPFDYSKLPKPKQKFISASVGAGTKFELYTIGKGTTTNFPVRFFDGIIGLGGVEVPKIKPATLTVDKIYHFTRMYASERAQNSQYMIFKSGNAKDPNEYVIAHVIKGLREGNEANYEQVALAKLTSSGTIEDGSIVVLDKQDDTVPLVEKQKITAAYLRNGLDEAAALPKELVEMTVSSIPYERLVPIDAGQDAAKKALGL